MSFAAKLSTSDRQSFASSSRERSSATSRTRSTSPVKNPDDLLKLEKPVIWTTPDSRVLRDTVKKTGSVQALGFFDDVWKVIQGEGYLPRELKKILKNELMVSESRFAAEDRVPVLDEKEVDDASPPSRGELETLGGKMIDYALLLQPDRDLAIRIADFVDGFDGHGPLTNRQMARYAMSPRACLSRPRLTSDGVRRARLSWEYG
ncbi:hypothetical protein QQX98_009955 [Neonectria punicea]|uniref:Uncharacterized protein n=1 Tax=Neonectria punicea TaxID=979145 RepID=A0ABR1GQV2_9HYPO